MRGKASAYWTTLYVNNEAWVENCGCETTLDKQSMCGLHWESFLSWLDEDDDLPVVKMVPACEDDCTSSRCPAKNKEKA